HQLEEHRVTLHFTGIAPLLFNGLRLPSQALKVVRDPMCRNPKKPRSKRSPAPFKLADPRQCLPKDVRRQVLRLMPVAYTPGDVRIDAVEVLLIELAKAGRVALSGLHFGPFVSGLRIHLSLR